MIGGDDTIFTVIDGRVKFERKGRDKKQVSVYPAEEYAAIIAAKHAEA